MTMEQALAVLGVRDDTLTPDEKAFLDANGYLSLEGVFVDQVEAFGARLEAIAGEEGERAGWELRKREGTGRIRFRRDAGAVRLGDLVNKDPLFEVCFTHPRVLAGVARVLRGECKLSSLNGRAALPGHGHQPLHVDWNASVAPGQYLVCNSIWLIDDFTEANGATRVVPGSHRSHAMPEEAMDDPAAPHPDEVLLLGKAGTVVIFNAHTWHGGTRNRTDKPRRAMHAYFCRRDQKQQTDQRHYARPETTARLSEAARFILDIL